MASVRENLQQFIRHLQSFRQLVQEQKEFPRVGRVIGGKFSLEEHFSERLEELDQLGREEQRKEVEWLYSNLSGLEVVSSEWLCSEGKFSLALYRLTYENILRELSERGSFLPSS